MRKFFRKNLASGDYTVMRIQKGTVPMEKFEEEQVWRRVLGNEEESPEGMDLRALLLSAMEAAAAYRQLSELVAGKQKERVRRLYEGEQANIACLRGMHRLSSGTVMKPKAMRVAGEPAAKLLEKCYHRTKQAMTEYTARTVDREFGAVFQKMADREREHCVLITELLGELGR